MRLLPALLIAFSFVRAQTPSAALLERAVAYVGGRERVMAVKSLTFVGSGISPNIGQNPTPDAALLNWNIPEYKKTLDLVNGRLRLEQHRVAGFPFALADDVRLVNALDGNIAFNVVGGNMQRAADATLPERRMELLGDPLSAVRAALHREAKLGPLRTRGTSDGVDVTTASRESFTIWFDRSTHLPSSLSWVTASDNLGDVLNETSFDGYERVSGLMLPKHFVTRMDFHNWVTSDIRISSITVDAPVPELAASAAVKAAAAPAPPRVFVDPVQVAKGVWWLAGSGNHRSVLLEFDDHLTLFEAPASEVRTKAVIDKARTLSSKPLTEVIVSHHHFDHTGGLRAAFAEGLTIVTHKGNEAFFGEIAARKATLRPDLLARDPKPVKLRTFDDQLVLKDQSMEVDLFQLKGNTHSSYLLMAWLPREKLLIQADLYDAGWIRDPWADNYANNLAARKLDVSRDIPIHGTIQTRAEELTTLAKMQH